jgi:hypothetical protein
VPVVNDDVDVLALLAVRVDNETLTDAIPAREMRGEELEPDLFGGIAAGLRVPVCEPADL